MIWHMTAQQHALRFSPASGSETRPLTHSHRHTRLPTITTTLTASASERACAHDATTRRQICACAALFERIDTSAYWRAGAATCRPLCVCDWHACAPASHIWAREHCAHPLAVRSSVGCWQFGVPQRVWPVFRPHPIRSRDSAVDCAAFCWFKSAINANTHTN